MTDQVNLCTSCNTMKHLDASGLCGRCSADNNRANPPKPRAKLGQSRADNAMAGELDSFKYFLRYLQAMPDVDKYALAPEQIDAIAVKVIILLENERARLLESLQGELPKWAYKAYYTKYPVLWKPIAPESNAEHYDAGFNQAVELVNQLLTKYVQGGENGENT